MVHQASDPKVFVILDPVRPDFATVSVPQGFRPPPGNSLESYLKKLFPLPERTNLTVVEAGDPEDSQPPMPYVDLDSD